MVFDVAVVGGGPAGVAAAVGAARAGARTLLIERGPCLGGQATQSNVVAFCGFHCRGAVPVQVVAGVGEQVLAQLRTVGQDTSCWVSPTTGNPSIRFHPELLKLALDQLVQHSGVQLRLHATLVGAVRQGARIVALECCDDSGSFQVEARAFVDATGDGSLAHLGGAATSWGDEQGVVQQAGLVVRIDRISPHAVTTPAAMAQAIARAKDAGMADLPKQTGFMIRVGDADTGYLTTPSYTVTDLSSSTLTDAEVALRRQAHAYLKALQTYLPGMEQCRMVSTGPQLGLRESRRIVGEYRLTVEDVLTAKKSEHTIAKGGWSPEVHANDQVSYTHLDDHAWFDIPIGCIKAAGTDNLWAAGRNISCDSTAHASVRVMGTSFATGHAAGVAAALSGADGGYDYPRIARELRRQGASLDH